ncbi:hypothetical protein QTN47_21325 [Danxiaibacter flavus]|uniref:Uncharacterized protein n=1 Tax=Danxiaibacter flavus TaxID=3049108 RepID=A0ABV3ZNJ6_9BACT|nr:hypothetical protein QNM32_21330 [Chitinophagaceae bacterium DXS]
MTNKKFFGLMGNASNFLKSLTLLDSSNHGWTEKYLDFNTGQHWLKYMIDRDSGRYFNLMLLTPKPTTEEMIDIAFTSSDNDEVEGAVHRLFIEEEDEKIEFRPALIERLKKIDISQLDAAEKKNIKTIILNGHLTDRTNKREVIGKHFSEIQKDVQFFNDTAEIAEQILKQL